MHVIHNEHMSDLLGFEDIIMDLNPLQCFQLKLIEKYLPESEFSICFFYSQVFSEMMNLSRRSSEYY